MASIIAQRRKAYLEALAAHPEHNAREVADAMGLNSLNLDKMRKSTDFVAKELAIIESHPVGAVSIPRVRELQVKVVKEKYLKALEENLGAIGAARKAARLKRSELDSLLRQDPAFKEAQDDVFADIAERHEVESVRIALGEAPKCRDSKHLEFRLKKMMPDRYGDKPKVIDHRHSGSLTLKSLDEEIAELLGDDPLDQIEGGNP